MECYFLNNVYKQEVIEVNSYHRQAIRKLASNFKVTAVSEDGIIEAIENAGYIPMIYADKYFFTLTAKQIPAAIYTVNCPAYYA